MVDIYNLEGDELALLNMRFKNALISLAATVTAIGVLITAAAAMLKPYVASAEDLQTIQEQVTQNTANIQKTTEAVHSLHNSVLEGRIDDYDGKIEDILVIPEADRTEQQRRNLVKLETKKKKLERKLTL